MNFPTAFLLRIPQPAASALRLRKTKAPARRRAGAAVVAMVVVLGGIAIALLILAGKTSVQMKSIQNTALEIQQCNELIDLGEMILTKRLASNPVFQGERIRLELPSSLAAQSNIAPQLAIIEMVLLENISSEKKQPWSISAYVGASEQSFRQTSKTIRIDTTSYEKNRNE